MILLKTKNSNIFNKLKYGKINSSGRDNSGLISLYHRGSGHKKVYRFVDYRKSIVNVPGFIVGFFYDPGRTALLSLVAYSNGVLCYTIATERTTVSSVVSTLILHGGNNSNNTTTESSFDKGESRPGYSAPLKRIRPGVNINSLELRLLEGAKYTRVAGSFSKLVSLTENCTYAIVKLKGHKLLKLNANCLATVGAILYWAPRFRVLNAGWSRLRNVRPTVRGVAMNPVDHPHGGGQGKTSGGRPSVSPWAKLTKSGLKTRKKYKYATFNMKR